MIQINQELDIDTLIEDITEAQCIGLVIRGNPVRAIPIPTLMSLLARYFPPIKDYANETSICNNS